MIAPAFASPTIPSPYRRAEKSDADSLAVLTNFAGEGMPEYLWSGMAEEGESALDVGRARVCREEGCFSYRNAVVREEGGQVVAILIGYRLSSAPDPNIMDDLPAMIVPLQTLENLVPGSWYINVLAAMPASRGLGYGSELLAIAEQLAARAGCAELSIIVSDANIGARKLYERCGFREAARREMVKDAWENNGNNWVLMTRTLLYSPVPNAVSS